MRIVRVLKNCNKKAVGLLWLETVKPRLYHSERRVLCFYGRITVHMTCSLLLRDICQLSLAGKGSGANVLSPCFPHCSAISEFIFKAPLKKTQINNYSIQSQIIPKYNQ